jgi:hypothetical protein
VVISKMDVAALSMGTIDGQTLKRRRLLMVRSMKVCQGDSRALATVALYLSLLAVDSISR